MGLRDGNQTGAVYAEPADLFRVSCGSAGAGAGGEILSLGKEHTAHSKRKAKVEK